MKYIAPSVDETAFNCPHCSALAKQFWFSVKAEKRKESDPTPSVFRDTDDRDWEFTLVEDEQMRVWISDWAKKMSNGQPFLEHNSKADFVNYDVFNLLVSRCFNCDQIAIWVHDRLAYPLQGAAPLPNPDMPESIKHDYIEASTILDLSPRGAAALIRLAIQKLCKELGKPGRNINDDIGALVKDGLDKRVQQALDAVRVIGNSAVHPGQIDLRDDRSTAESLFRLLNLIVDKTISEPKQVADVYGSLPKNLIEAIEKRDQNS